ncbi:MAG: cyclic nucleotide-binding domain-containing protein, partial [Campylobacteraceae bacterium]|nr:cyclic nucleotide-binding domain-containing protein [Campylobacteraceae bacterium]
MSIHDQKTFLTSIHPFEMLDKVELEKTLNSLNIAYYKKNETLISPEKKSEFLYIVVKGEVGEFREDELIKIYTDANIFDADALIYSKTKDEFKVMEELICFELDKKVFLSLFDTNDKFKDFFIKDLANKIQSAKQKEYSTQLSGFMIAKVYDTYINEP